MNDETEALVGALHALLFLQFRHWPLTDADKAIPFVRSRIVPILPLVEAYHVRLHGDDVPLWQATAEDRARWASE
jgi:hypothetical protein